MNTADFIRLKYKDEAPPPWCHAVVTTGGSHCAVLVLFTLSACRSGNLDAVR